MQSLNVLHMKAWRKLIFVKRTWVYLSKSVENLIFKIDPLQSYRCSVPISRINACTQQGLMIYC